VTITRPLEARLERLAAIPRPRVLDLFSGCGGLSLGFQAAGCDVVGAVELDPTAAATHGINFHPSSAPHRVPRDITASEMTPSRLAKDLQLGRMREAVDIIVGGPPCQAFARVGRPKLREIDDNPEAYRHDPRARLYLNYLEHVAAFRPAVVLMENVPDVLNHGGQNIAEEVCEALEAYGYTARYTLLNAAYYGVPQMRERMFLLAYRKELEAEVRFPEATHWVELPRGYESSRRVALRLLSGTEGIPEVHRYVSSATSDLEPAVSAKDAIHDLPPICDHLEGRMRRGARRLDSMVRYDARRRVSAYARSLREWPGFESNTGTTAHVMRHLPRDWPIFERMDSGDQYPEAHAHAQALFRERLAELSHDGAASVLGPGDYRLLEKRIVPPYDPAKFPNKWWKMHEDRPVRTLMAHIGKDSYSHIHYDSKQARTISVREAARLQSFPDGFRFAGAMNSGFRQIGNAVPPLLARALADKIRETLLDRALKMASMKCLETDAAD